SVERCGAGVAGLQNRSRSWGAPPANEAAHGTRQAGTPAARWGDVLDGRQGHDEGQEQEAEDALRPEAVPEGIGGRGRADVIAAPVRVGDDDVGPTAHERDAGS